MPEKFTKFLIGYTISNDEARRTFKSKLEETYNGVDGDGNPMLEWINESMYELRGMDLNALREKLNETYQNVLTIGFGGDDFIKLYYAAHLVNQSVPDRKLDFIVEENISNPANKSSQSR